MTDPDWPFLDTVLREVIREQAIRTIATQTGETYDIVAEQFDAMQSMDREAVLDLAEGEPTTLEDALRRYVNTMTTGDDQNVTDIRGDLETLLAYPWPGAEKTQND